MEPARRATRAVSHSTIRSAVCADDAQPVLESVVQELQSREDLRGNGAQTERMNDLDANFYELVERDGGDSVAACHAPLGDVDVCP